MKQHNNCECDYSSNYFIRSVVLLFWCPRSDAVYFGDTPAPLLRATDESSCNRMTACFCTSNAGRENTLLLTEVLMEKWPAECRIE